MANLLIDMILLIGEQNVEDLLLLKGGQKVYIPTEENLTEEHWLVKVVGKAAATSLSKRFGAGSLVLPLGLFGNRNRLHNAIERGLKNGNSLNNLVSLTGVSRKTISRIRAKNRGAVEPPLFKFFKK
jgi:hypothetical protein